MNPFKNINYTFKAECNFRIDLYRRFPPNCIPLLKASLSTDKKKREQHCKRDKIFEKRITDV